MTSIVLSGGEVEKVEKYKIDELEEGLYIPINFDHIRVYVDEDNKPAFLIDLNRNTVWSFHANIWNLDSFKKDTNTTAITFTL